MKKYDQKYKKISMKEFRKKRDKNPSEDVEKDIKVTTF